ncbi:alpha-glucosidase-like [Hylaeus anthracinus]|uniref:alpha-glucosidase-like n=1 Tax=Hylaeus anthracinus TaxID=313031 RepID=UPI0023B990CE|nr:alpha-glucosidase-like [Hylaeus anthracinus]
MNYVDRSKTKDQPETYDIISSWKRVLDKFNETKIIMIEAYTNWTSTMKYYDAGADMPFNFQLITDIHKNSNASDLKRIIDRWMEGMPEGSVANWVAGNHDNPRMKSRLGPQIARAATVMTQLLPGVAVTYNGDEIGMTDGPISWEDTVDPLGCAAGKDGYKSTSRDPERTPFQWDRSTSAGFSTNNKTWLPINPNYKTVNVESERKNPGSDYNMYLALAKLRKTSMVKNGQLITMTTDNVLLIARKSDYDGAVYAAVNVGDKRTKVNMSVFNTRSQHAKPMRLYYSSPEYKAAPKALATNRTIHLPPSAVVIYIDDYGF